MSTNFPFSFAGPENEPLIGRQGLYGFDITQHWLGVELVFLKRSQYQEKLIPKGIKHNDSLIIAEGGFGKLAITGIAEIINELGGENYDHIFCPVGTGATYLGLCNSKQVSSIHGILTLNNLTEIESNSEFLGIPIQNLYSDYIFGKYANQPNELVDFCNTFSVKHQLKIEPIYTGRMFYGLYELIKNDSFQPGSKLLALHTGGLKS
jgi:1-aminocyclopropane-1-carboxylate deaminase